MQSTASTKSATHVLVISSKLGGPSSQSAVGINSKLLPIIMPKAFISGACPDSLNFAQTPASEYDRPASKTASGAKLRISKLRMASRPIVRATPEKPITTPISLRAVRRSSRSSSPATITPVTPVAPFKILVNPDVI